MTHFKNLETYLVSGILYAKNSPKVQAGYRISFDDIVARRGSAEFTTPCGANVNDFVTFYCSPCTKMAYSIHSGNVPLKAPNGAELGTANMDDVVYMVVSPMTLFTSGRSCWYTDIACNSGFPATYNGNPTELETHIEWPLFDDTPRMGHIPEIGYEGVCRWQHDRDQPIEHQMRSKKRMAEFMVKDHLQMNEVSCIILKNRSHLAEVQAWVNASDTQIPVYVKPGCFF